MNGVGGIGKTELAKRHAYLHQQEYARVLFLPFQNSIEETLCQDFFEIYHGNVSDDDEEDKAEDSQEKLYASRLRLLEEDLTPQDLLILDNFDTFDEKILDLLQNPCHHAAGCFGLQLSAADGPGHPRDGYPVGDIPPV